MTDTQGLSPTPPTPPPSGTYASQATGPVNYQPNVALYSSEVELADAIALYQNPPEPLQTSALANAITNFNKQFTAQYGSQTPAPGAPLYPSPLSVQVEKDITTPLSLPSGNTQTLLSLAQTNPAGLAPYFSGGEYASATSLSTDINNAVYGMGQDPQGYGSSVLQYGSLTVTRNGISTTLAKDVPANIQSFKTNYNAIMKDLNATPPVQPPLETLQNAAQAIVNLNQDFNMMANLDPMCQTIDWAINATALPGGSSLVAYSNALLPPNTPSQTDINNFENALQTNSNFIGQLINFNFQIPNTPGW